MIYYF